MYRLRTSVSFVKSGYNMAVRSLSTYKISVKTGDKRGDGTDANVSIRLHGQEARTNTYDLDNFFQTGNIDDFSVTSEINIPEVQRIELWRDNCGWFSNWYLEWIEVTNPSSEITTKFSVMKWIKSGQHYFLNHIAACLPQDEQFKEQRKMELINMQNQYQLEVKSPGLPAQVKELPGDEQFSVIDGVSLLARTGAYRLAAAGLVKTHGKEWTRVDDIKDVYTELFGTPQGAQYFNDDASFGRQRISSLNSALIKLCEAIPPNLAVDDEMLKPLLEGKTIKQTIDGKRLFIVDLAILEGVSAKTSEMVIPCPIALFYFNSEGNLMPIAIQLFQQKGQDNPVFLQNDPKYTWMLAKLWYNLADATYHETLTHLNFTHLIMEGICVSSKRQLSQSHPVNKLLTPHFMYLMAINSLSLVTLINPGGYFDKASNVGTKAAFLLIKKSLVDWKLDVNGTLPEELRSRGVLDSLVLPEKFHFRDDALLLYDAIKTYVTKFISLYYSAEGSLKADYEIQQWGAELVKSRDEGGVGILGVPNNGVFEVIDQLVVTLTAIIYACSVGHAAANFQQYDEYGAPLNYPFSMNGTPPKDKMPVTIETILESIANREQLLEVMSITKVLSEKGTQSLGDFERNLIVDPRAVEIVQEFREELRKIGLTIDERNNKREFPYPWLHPDEIPNAISI